jgi:hypothetical protein
MIITLTVASCFTRRPTSLRLPGVWAAHREGIRTWMIGLSEPSSPDGLSRIEVPDPEEVERRNGVRRYAAVGDNILIVELAFPDRHGRTRCMLVYSLDTNRVEVIWTPFKIERAIANSGKELIFVDLP